MGFSNFSSDEVSQQENNKQSKILQYVTINSLKDFLYVGFSYVSAIKQFIFPTEDPVDEAEIQFLRCVKHNFYRYYVELNENCKIWTLSSVPYPCSPEDLNEEKPPVVLIHGLLSGLAFWAMNLDEILDTGHILYAIDLPGFGRSTRIDFSEDDQETEDIFVEHIEMWRKKIGMSKMIAVGHSFGGYITTIYAMKYPQYVKHMILVDPWGFPDVREEVTAVLECGGTDTLSTPLINLPIWVRVVMMVFMPFSPFTFLRLSGKHIGPKIIHYLRPDMTLRFSSLFGEEDINTVPNYIYHTNKFSPTGENAFRSLAMPLAWAKNPLIKRISGIDKSVQITFVYGSRSWIDFQTGFEVKNILKGHNVSVHVIDEAGHHLFADQPELFNSLIRQIINGNVELMQDRFESLTELSTLTVRDLSMKTP